MSAPGAARPKSSRKPGRWAAALAAVLLVGSVGCGDPVVILGDQPGIMRVVAGIPADQLPGEGTPATREPLTGPRGVAVDGDGVLYVADHRASRILAVFSDGSMETVVDHRGCAGDMCIDRPDQIVLDGAGSLLVADGLGGRIWRVSLVGGNVTVVAGRPGGTPPALGVTATEAELDLPTGVAISAAGRVFFSERNAHRVWTVGATGVLEPAVGTGDRGGGGDGGPAVSAQLFLPGSISIAGGRLFIADRGNHRIRVVELESGIIGTVAGNGTPSFSGDRGPATSAGLRFPEGVLVTPDGATLFIADTGNNRVRSVNLATGVIQSFAGTGDPEFVGSGLEAGSTALDQPVGLAVGAGSLLFISDSGHGLVWRTPVRF